MVAKTTADTRLTPYSKWSGFVAWNDVVQTSGAADSSSMLTPVASRLDAYRQIQGRQRDQLSDLICLQDQFNTTVGCCNDLSSLYRLAV
jgi:hypothetical protein